jgi:hypothetical protein
LRYEFEIRKLQAKKINEGSSFRTALKEAMADTALRDRHFITPLVIGCGTRTGGRPRESGAKGKRAFSEGSRGKGT